MQTYSRLSIPMTYDEREALIAKARKEYRDPRDQAALEVRRALERDGLLKALDITPAQPSEVTT